MLNATGRRIVTKRSLDIELETLQRRAAVNPPSQYAVTLQKTSPVLAFEA